MTASAASNPRRPVDFQTTRWTRVCLAKAESAEGRLALGELCAAYYEPVVAYLGSILRDGDAARDMGHAFFAEVLAGGKIHHADAQKGRFRHYLLGAVKHFVAHEREAARRLRRGGTAVIESLDDAQAAEISDTRECSPEAAFDRQWAITLIGRAVDALRTESIVNGKSLLFEKLQPTLLGEAEHGELAATAAELGMTEGAMKVAAHRLRQRFRQCVKNEVANTLTEPSALDEEMRALFAALGG